jgi:hypothetical protein
VAARVFVDRVLDRLEERNYSAEAMQRSSDSSRSDACASLADQARADRMARTTLCEWRSDRCQKTAKPRSSYCAEHHALVFKAPNPGEKRLGIGPLTKESIQKAQARRKAKLGRG